MRYPSEGVGGLAVPGHTGAIGSDSLPTPSGGYPVSGAGSRSFSGVPVVGGGGTAFCEAEHYLEYYDKVSKTFRKKISFDYSVVQKGNKEQSYAKKGYKNEQKRGTKNEQREEYHGHKNQSSRHGVSEVAEAGKSGRDGLLHTGSPYSAREYGATEKLNWLESTCDKQGVGWFITAECDNGHSFAKELICGKEWCSICGEDKSSAHGRRFSRWLPKGQQMKSMGYWDFTLPPEVRHKYRTKKSLRKLGHDIQELLKAFGFKRGLRRWHWFGDIAESGLRGDTPFHPHLNCLVDGRWDSPAKLEAVRKAYAKLLNVPKAVAHYHYTKRPGKMVHHLYYITRATFRDYSWDERMAMELRGFRNMVVWGGVLWKGEPQWSLSDLKGEGKAEVEGLDLEAIQSLHESICPICAREDNEIVPLKWGATFTDGFVELGRKEASRCWLLAIKRHSTATPTR